MTRARAIGLFAGVLLFTLVLLMPMGLGLKLFGVDEAGLSAQGASGDVWTGRLTDARFGPVALGDVRMGLRPLPLLVGRAELGANAVIGAGRLVASPSTFGISETTARVPLAAAFAPLPLDMLDLADASIRFRGDRCETAKGGVRATFAGDVAGLALSAGLSGVARCDGGELLLPLVSQSAMERLTLRIKGNGQWRALLRVQSGDPALAAKLAASGFRAVAGGYTMRLSGRL